MTSEIKYIPHGDNRVLRHVLRVVWDNQCYWCSKFKNYTELAIDHIVPQTATPKTLKRIEKQFALPKNYDVHALGNLAPICTPCNTNKSNEDLVEVPAVLSKLKKARMHAPTVQRRVVAFHKSKNLGGALLEISEADLTKKKQLETFVEEAAAIVQRLADVQGGIDYFVVREVSVEAWEQDHSIDLRLNEEGRAAVTMLEDVAGGDLADALSAPLEALFSRIASEVSGLLEDHDDGLGAPVAGNVSIDWPTVVVSAVRCAASAPAELFFEFDGEVEASTSASVSRSSFDGGELEDLQGDALITCHFTFTLNWEPSDPIGDFSFGDVWLWDVEVDATLDGRASRWWEKAE